MDLYFIFIPFTFGFLLNFFKNTPHITSSHLPMSLFAGCILIGSKSLCLSMTIDKILTNIFKIKSHPIPLGFLSTYMVTIMI